MTNTSEPRGAESGDRTAASNVSDRTAACAALDAQARLATIRRRFEDFAEAYPGLPLYRAICEGVLTEVGAGHRERPAAPSGEIARLLLAARPGQERPVLLFAALHDLVLRLGPGGTPAARWYASVVGRSALPVREMWGAPGAIAESGPWRDVRTTLLDHRSEIECIIASRSTQTNEVNRSVYVLAMLALAADFDVPGVDAPLPVTLLELGCSAGLLLTCDRYHVRITRPDGPDLAWGDARSAVVASGEDRTPAEAVPLVRRGVEAPKIVARVGLDSAPVGFDDEDALRWLGACLWPDVPRRFERFEAAVRQRQNESDSVELLAGDITDPVTLTAALQRSVDAARRSGHEAVRFGYPATTMPLVRPNLHVVVLSSWALTYVERDERARIGRVIGGFASATGLPVTWCMAEPADALPGVGPLPDGAESSARRGTTMLAARRWRGGRELPPVVWGMADPHGNWLCLQRPGPDAPA